jgi:hypothetical protein
MSYWEESINVEEVVDEEDGTDMKQIGLGAEDFILLFIMAVLMNPNKSPSRSEANT